MSQRLYWYYVRDIATVHTFKCSENISVNFPYAFRLDTTTTQEIMVTVISLYPPIVCPARLRIMSASMKIKFANTHEQHRATSIHVMSATAISSRILSLSQNNRFLFYITYTHTPTNFIYATYFVYK